MRDRNPLNGPFNGKVLVINYSALGDVLIGIPFLRAYKEKYPKSSLYSLVCTPYDSFFSGESYLDGLLVWDRSKDEKAFLKCLIDVRKHKFDCILDLKWTDRSGLMTYFSNCPLKVGGRKFPLKVYSHLSKDLAGFCGIHPERVPKPYLLINSEERLIARELISMDYKKLVFCVIGASKKIKRWPIERWISFTNLAGENGFACLLIGHGAEEEDIASSIVSGSSRPAMIRDMTGKLKLRDMAALSSFCNVAVGGDSGPLHLARVMGIPVVGLFGPTDPWNTGFSEICRAIRVRCPKSGCFNWDCTNQSCLGDIEPDEVWTAVEACVLDRAELLEG